MSLTQTVIDMVEERGSATENHLLPKLAEEGYTRAQVRKALQNARFRGLLDVRKGKGLGKGSEPGTYTLAKPAAAPCHSVRLASVWDLGAR